MNYKLIISLVLAGLAVVFIIQNVAIVEIQFLFWTLAISRALLMFLLLAIGVIIGMLIQSYTRHRKNKPSGNS